MQKTKCNKLTGIMTYEGKYPSRQLHSFYKPKYWHRLLTLVRTLLLTLRRWYPTVPRYATFEVLTAVLLGYDAMSLDIPDVPKAQLFLEY
jgi:hypothetical protein